MNKTLPRSSVTGWGIILITLFLAVDSLAQTERPGRSFMREKLTFSQGILEGLALENYDLIVTNATKLRSMNLTNAFFQLRNPYYLENITNLQAKVDSLVKSAKENNLSQSAANYSEVINSCVTCHQTFRVEQFRKRTEAPK